MRFTIMSQSAGMPLQLDISGYHLEISDISAHANSNANSERTNSISKKTALEEILPEPLKLQ